MKIWKCAIICSVSAAIVGSANAGVISTLFAGVQNKTLFVPVGGDLANVDTPGVLRRAQGFSVTSPIVLDSVSILGESVKIGTQTLGDSVTLLITDGLGNTGDSVVFSQTYSNVTADAAGVPTWHSFNIGLTGLTLATPGEYFLVIGSNGPDGFVVSQGSSVNTVGLTNRGFLFSQPSDPVADNSNWFFFSSNNILATQFFGSAIPAPGSLALVAVSGLLLIPRRNR